MSEQMECPICMEKISTTDMSYTLTKPCNHYYHLECIKPWSKISSSTCPKCREEIQSLFIVNQGRMETVAFKKGDKYADMVQSNSHQQQLDDRLIEARGRAQGEEERNHLGSQICSICDASVLINQSIICPQCSALYHKSCSDGLNCPFCEEWIDDLSTIRKAKKTKKYYDDSKYYVDLVDELQKRNLASPIVEKREKLEDVAWNMLDQINDTLKEEKEEKEKEEEAAEAAGETLDANVSIPKVKERELKRPKRTGRVGRLARGQPNGPLKLTAESLAQLEQPTLKAEQITEHRKLTTESLALLDPRARKLRKSVGVPPLPRSARAKPQGLSFTQKLLVQRLLLKPRLRKDLSKKLSFDAYTELNKKISHKLYVLVERNELGVSAMNAVIELAEREGDLPFENRKSVDVFYDKCKDNDIVMRFIDCNWDVHMNDKIRNIIETEIREFIK